MALARLFVVLMLPTAFVTATIYMGTGQTWPSDHEKTRMTAVQWGDGTFTTRRGFQMWLEANGGNYARWARNHPKAAELLSRPKARRAAIRSAVSERPTATAVSTERRIRLTLTVIAIAALALAAIPLLRRLPSPAMPAIGVVSVARQLAPSGPGMRTLRPSRRLSLPRLTMPRPTLPRVERPKLAAPRLRAPALRIPRPAVVNRERLAIAVCAVGGLAFGLLLGIVVPFVLAL